MVIHHDVAPSPNEQVQALLGREQDPCPSQVEIRSMARFTAGSNLISALESDGPITGPRQVLSFSFGVQPVLCSYRDVGWLPTLPSFPSHDFHSF